MVVAAPAVTALAASSATPTASVCLSLLPVVPAVAVTMMPTMPASATPIVSSLEIAATTSVLTARRTTLRSVARRIARAKAAVRMAAAAPAVPALADSSAIPTASACQSRRPVVPAAAASMMPTMRASAMPSALASMTAATTSVHTAKPTILSIVAIPALTVASGVAASTIRLCPVSVMKPAWISATAALTPVLCALCPAADSVHYSPI